VTPIWDQCYDLLNIFAKKWRNKNGILTQRQAKLCKNFIIILCFFEKNAFFRRKLSKIAVNWDHNIDPCFEMLSKIYENESGRKKGNIFIYSVTSNSLLLLPWRRGLHSGFVSACHRGVWSYGS
jgi:hypothetical protein